MASLTRIALNADRIKEGAWVDVQVDGEPFQVKIRGFTPSYRDALHKARQEAARAINRKKAPGADLVMADGLPPSVDEPILGKVLADECFQDVRGLKHSDDGPNVTADEFRSLLCDPEVGRVLMQLVQAAAIELMNARSGEIKSAVGNLETVSAGS